MTLPTLTPCPKLDCRAPITHWHDNNDAYVFACYVAMRGEPCPHGNRGNPCYAPRETAPLHLLDVDAVARAIFESDHNTNWDGASEHIKDEYRRNARDVLDLIAAHQPVWKRVEPGTLIKEGTRVKSEGEGGSAHEYTAGMDFSIDDPGAWAVYIDPRTVPAEPEDPRVAVVLEFLDQTEPETHERDARELLARIDAMGGEGR